MSTKAIERVFCNRNELIDGYTDLPETKRAVREFREHMPGEQWAEFDDLFFNATSAFEAQGFIYGFQYAVELLVKCGI